MDWRTGCTRSKVPITQKHPVALVKNTHVIWSDVTRTVPLPLPAMAWLGPLACPCGALAPRSKYGEADLFAGRAVGRTDRKGSQMHVCGVSRVGPSRVRFVSDRVRARARGSRGPCEVRGDDNADRLPSRVGRIRSGSLSAVAPLPNSEGQGAQNFGVIQFPRNPRPLGHSSHRASFFRALLSSLLPWGFWAR